LTISFATLIVHVPGSPADGPKTPDLNPGDAENAPVAAKARNTSNPELPEKPRDGRNAPEAPRSVAPGAWESRIAAVASNSWDSGKAAVAGKTWVRWKAPETAESVG
jgi:hypothetical protein